MNMKGKIPHRSVDAEYDGHWEPFDSYADDHLKPYGSRAGWAYQVGVVHQVKYTWELNKERKRQAEENEND